MQIPERLQRFSRPAILVTADSVRAIFYQIKKDAIEKLETFFLPRAKKSDNETSFVNVDHGWSKSGPEPKIEQERLHRFGKEVAKCIIKHLQKTKYGRLYIVMPKEVMREIEQAMPKAITNNIACRVKADLMKIDALEVLQRCLTKFL